MAYSPTVWADGITPVNAANLNKIEAAVDALDAFVGVGPDLNIPGAAVTVNSLAVASEILDTGGKWFINPDGALQWGPGDWSRDTDLYRSAVATLQTQSSLFLKGGVGTYFGIFANISDGNSRFYINGADGSHNWGPGNAGADTDLQRAGAGLLYTNSTFASAKDIVANRGAAGQIWLNQDGSIYFGSAVDVKLYRSAGGALTVDGALYVTGNFSPNAGRLGVIAQQVADWDLALDNGWYMASPGLNAPAGLTVWVIGEVIAHGATGYRVQRVFDFTSQMDSQVYERRQQGGAWQPWVKVGFYGDGTGAQKTDSTVVANKFLTQLGTANQILIEADGRIYFGSASDTNLYRIAAGYLATDQAFYAKGEVCANYATATQILLQANGRLSFGSGIDTHLYRSAAGVLKTDGQIEVGATGIKFSNGSVQTVAAAAAKTVVGSVAGNGGILSGSGFTVSRTGTGQYTITFSPAFATTPVVVVSPNRNGMIFIYADAPASTGGFSVIARTTGGGTEDNDFSFHAIAT